MADTTNTDMLLVDKVAASRAMMQNVSLKERLEELQGALVSCDWLGQ